MNANKKKSTLPVPIDNAKEKSENYYIIMLQHCNFDSTTQTVLCLIV